MSLKATAVCVDSPAPCLSPSPPFFHSSIDFPFCQEHRWSLNRCQGIARTFFLHSHSLLFQQVESSPWGWLRKNGLSRCLLVSLFGLGRVSPVSACPGKLSLMLIGACWEDLFVPLLRGKKDERSTQQLQPRALNKIKKPSSQ